VKRVARIQILARIKILLFIAAVPTLAVETTQNSKYSFL
jgi:hypothetical protein